MKYTVASLLSILGVPAQGMRTTGGGKSSNSENISNILNTTPQAQSIYRKEGLFKNDDHHMEARDESESATIASEQVAAQQQQQHGDDIKRVVTTKTDSSDDMPKGESDVVNDEDDVVVVAEIKTFLDNFQKSPYARGPSGTTKDAHFIQLGEASDVKKSFRKLSDIVPYMQSEAFRADFSFGNPNVLIMLGFVLFTRYVVDNNIHLTSDSIFPLFMGCVMHGAAHNALLVAQHDFSEDNNKQHLQQANNVLSSTELAEKHLFGFISNDRRGSVEEKTSAHWKKTAIPVMFNLLREDLSYYTQYKVTAKMGYLQSCARAAVKDLLEQQRTFVL